MPWRFSWHAKGSPVNKWPQCLNKHTWSFMKHMKHQGPTDFRFFPRRRHRPDDFHIPVIGLRASDHHMAIKRLKANLRRFGHSSTYHRAATSKGGPSNGLNRFRKLHGRQRRTAFEGFCSNFNGVISKNHQRQSAAWSKSASGNRANWSWESDGCKRAAIGKGRGSKGSWNGQLHIHQGAAILEDPSCHGRHRVGNNHLRADNQLLELVQFLIQSGSPTKNSREHSQKSTIFFKNNSPAPVPRKRSLQKHPHQWLPPCRGLWRSPSAEHLQLDRYPLPIWDQLQDVLG